MLTPLVHFHVMSSFLIFIVFIIIVHCYHHCYPYTMSHNCHCHNFHLSHSCKSSSLSLSSPSTIIVSLHCRHRCCHHLHCFCYFVICNDIMIVKVLKNRNFFILHFRGLPWWQSYLVNTLFVIPLLSANKGFVQSNILQKAAVPSPAGSSSSLNADDLDEVASEYSTETGDDSETLPWLAGQNQTPPPAYPEVTQVSQGQGQVQGHAEASPPPPPYEYVAPETKEVIEHACAYEELREGESSQCERVLTWTNSWFL
jgi:hypothetical protein